MPRIYLDNSATTPLDPRVKKAMNKFDAREFGNPSGLYKEGRSARKSVEEARGTIAGIIKSRPDEIIFTSGGTESDNLAIFGAANHLMHLAVEPPSALSQLGGSTAKSYGHIITTKIEHPAVLNPCKELEKRGFEVTYLEVNKDGFVSPDAVKRALRLETILVSIIYANNEVGTVQPVGETAKVIRDFKKSKLENRETGPEAIGKSLKFAPYPYFHVDACQASGYLDLNVEKLGVDMMTVNGSKMYGPKGTGFLYVKRGTKIEPLFYGGGQERKMRSGTENVAGIVGLAEAMKISDRMKEKESARLSKLRDYFIGRLTKEIPQTFLNGSLKDRLPNNINVSILGTEGEAVVLYLDEAGIACSTGSACSSESLEPSHVIMALGKGYEYGHGSLRFTMGRSTKKSDIDYVMKVLPEIVKKLRSFSAIK